MNSGVTTRSMITVKVRENEPFDVALRRFKRSCEKSGILTEIKKREFYEKPAVERKKARASAVKRRARRLLRENPGRAKHLRGKGR